MQMGTLANMSKDVMMAQMGMPVRRSSDVWGAGCALVQLIIGK